MAISGNLGTAKLKAMAISMWKRGGLHTLMKIAPRVTTPNPTYAAIYCTTFKYIAGRTSIEIEEIVGLANGSKLVGGTDIFIVDPLPLPAQFELRGYSQCPAGVATDMPAYIPHSGCPPGLGALWELVSTDRTKVDCERRAGQQIGRHPACAIRSRAVIDGRDMNVRSELSIAESCQSPCGRLRHCLLPWDGSAARAPVVAKQEPGRRAAACRAQHRAGRRSPRRSGKATAQRTSRVSGLVLSPGRFASEYGFQPITAWRLSVLRTAALRLDFRCGE